MTAPRPRTHNQDRPTLSIDPIACTGHGLCVELRPEMISLDEWGYPILDPTPIPTELNINAKHAVAHCPTLALRLNRRR